MYVNQEHFGIFDVTHWALVEDKFDFIFQKPLYQLTSVPDSKSNIIPRPTLNAQSDWILSLS